MPEPLDLSSPKSTIERIRIRRAQDATEIEKLTEQVALMKPEDIARKILAEKRQNERIKKWAGIDSLTGLPTRKEFIQHAKREMEVVNRDPNHRILAMGLADIDDFGGYNKRRGTHIGDAVLRGIGEKLIGITRETDVPCRWGGEELAVLLPSAARDRDLEFQPIERIREKCNEIEIEEGGNTSREEISLSFGATDYRPNETFESFFNRASNALRIAKLLGKARTVVSERDQDGIEILRDVTSSKVYTLRSESGSEILGNLTDSINYRIEKGEKPEDKPYLVKLD